MFRKYGIIGLVMILFAEIMLYFHIEPFVSWFFPVVWWGYILLLDAIVFKMKGNSLIMNYGKIFLTLIVLSVVFWVIFELFVQLYYPYWLYEITIPTILLPIFGLLSFSTVVPAVFETADLIKAFHFFDHKKLKYHKKHRLKKKFLLSLAVASLICIGCTVMKSDKIIQGKPSKVLRHVVLFKFKDGTTPQDIKKVEKAFKELPGKIGAINDFEWGVNVSVENLSQDYTHCFFLTFLSEEDRAVYLPHPAHKEFGSSLSPYLDKVLVIDYWTNE